MKILLDENLDYDFKLFLPEHDVWHVDDMGWKGLKNGSLVQAAEQNSFDALVTADRNFQYQQNIASRSLALVVLEVHPNNIASLARISPQVLSVLASAEPGQVYTVPPNF